MLLCVVLVCVFGVLLASPVHQAHPEQSIYPVQAIHSTQLVNPPHQTNLAQSTQPVQSIHSVHPDQPPSTLHQPDQDDSDPHHPSLQPRSSHSLIVVTTTVAVEPEERQDPEERQTTEPQDETENEPQNEPKNESHGPQTEPQPDPLKDLQNEAQIELQKESHEPQNDPQSELWNEAQIEAHHPLNEPQTESPYGESMDHDSPQQEPQPDSPYQEHESVFLESLSSEILKVVAPSTDSAPQPDSLSSSDSPSHSHSPESPSLSPTPSTAFPSILKPVFERITPAPTPSSSSPDTSSSSSSSSSSSPSSSSSSSPSPPHPKSPKQDDAPFQASPLESEVFGAKFFQPSPPKPVFVKPTSTKPSSAKSASTKSLSVKSASVKLAPSKTVFISKPVTQKPVDPKPETRPVPDSQPTHTRPSPDQPVPSQPAILRPAPSQSVPSHPASSQPNYPQPALPFSQHIHTQPTHSQPTPQFSLSQPDPRQAPQSFLQPASIHPAPSNPYLHTPSSTHRHIPRSSSPRNEESVASNLVLSGFGRFKPIHSLRSRPVQPQPSLHRPFPPLPEKRKDSEETMDFLVSLGPLTLLTSPSKASSAFSGLISHPQPQDAPLLPQNERKGRSNDVTSVSLPPQPNPALAPFTTFTASSRQPPTLISQSQFQYTQFLPQVKEKGRSNDVPSASLSPQPNPTLGRLTLPTSQSKANSALITHPQPRDVRFLPQEEKGRRGDVPPISLSPQPHAAPKKFLPRSLSSTQRHPVFKRLPRLAQEDGDDSRVISFSVDAPPHAVPPQAKIVSKSKGLPTLSFASSQFDLPRPAPPRPEEKKEEKKEEEDKAEEEGRAVPHPTPPRPAPDSRPVRTVYPAASPPLAPQGKAAPIHLPRDRPYQGKRPAEYDFSYTVQGGYGSAPFSHEERRAGPETRGSYVVALPDGRVQRVTYYVSGDSGFVADVSYEGEAVHPQPGPAYAHPRSAPGHPHPGPHPGAHPGTPAANPKPGPLPGYPHPGPPTAYPHPGPSPGHPHPSPLPAYPHSGPPRAYRSEPTHEDTNAPQLTPSHQPAPAYRSEQLHENTQPAQPVRTYRSEPPHEPRHKAPQPENSASAYTSESEAQPAQPTSADRVETAPQQPSKSHQPSKSSLRYSVSLPHQLTEPSQNETLPQA